MERCSLVRKLDKTGRIVLPLELRRDWKLEPGGEVGFDAAGEAAELLLTPSVQPDCPGARLDELGRVMIPPSLRSRLQIRENTSMRINWLPGEGKASLSPVTPSCCICGGIDALYPIKQTYVCRECRSELRRSEDGSGEDL